MSANTAASRHPQLLLLDAALTIRQAPEEFCRIASKSHQEITGLSLHDVCQLSAHATIETLQAMLHHCHVLEVKAKSQVVRVFAVEQLPPHEGVFAFKIHVAGPSCPMAEKLHQAQNLAEIGRHTAGVAHEINDPLTVILGSLDVALGRMTQDDPNREFIQMAFNQAERVERMGQALLELARLNEIILKPTQINNVVDRFIKRQELLLQQYGVRCNTTLQADLPLVHADEHRLEQIIGILLTNARQAVEEQPNREINVATKRINGSYVCLTVEDNGPGISKNIAHMVGEPFFTTKSKMKGTGLGLALAKKLAEYHSATLSFEPVTPTGTVFTLRLPAKITSRF